MICSLIVCVYFYQDFQECLSSINSFLVYMFLSNHLNFRCNQPDSIMNKHKPTTPIQIPLLKNVSSVPSVTTFPHNIWGIKPLLGTWDTNMDAPVEVLSPSLCLAAKLRLVNSFLMLVWYVTSTNTEHNYYLPSNAPTVMSFHVHYLVFMSSKQLFWYSYYNR